MNREQARMTETFFEEDVHRSIVRLVKCIDGTVVFERECFTPRARAAAWKDAWRASRAAKLEVVE